MLPEDSLEFVDASPYNNAAAELLSASGSGSGSDF